MVIDYGNSNARAQARCFQIVIFGINGGPKVALRYLHLFWFQRDQELHEFKGSVGSTRALSLADRKCLLRFGLTVAAGVL
jgi:hypothetical protein